ncbi:hypothetical protein ACH5RR_025068 [Cinchona calisaya]|uniref:Uncharacterized protein n=1 Tax=Cinchona calisaya TaxID=153742 RepID=A0ABD2Z0K8_9GENT
MGSATGFWQWNSPIAYIYCILGFLLVILASALVILFCSHENSSPSPQSEEDDIEEKQAKKMNSPDHQEMITVVIVFPGHENPMYLAKPQASIAATADNVKNMYNC